MQCPAQIGAGLFFSRIGPHQEGEVLARLWRIAPQNEIGEQGSQAWRTDGDEWLANCAHLESP
jgi:hypothetical protein